MFVKCEKDERTKRIKKKCVNSYQDLNPLLLYGSLIVGGITNSHQCVHITLFQVLEHIKREDFRERICKRLHKQMQTETEAGVPL